MSLITRGGKGSKLSVEEMDGNLLYLESIGLSGTNYVFVSTNGTDVENALELQSAYDKAKEMSPSSDNRITVVAAPGNYNLFIALREKTWYKRFTSIKPDTIKAPEPYQPNILKRLYYYITKNNLQDEVYKSLSSLVKDYTKSNLDENTKQEINFICKGYYLVDMRYYYKYMEYLGMNP